MKKTYLSILLAFSIQLCMGQSFLLNEQLHRIDNSEVQNFKKRATTSNKSASEFNLYIDYQVANFDDNFYVWRFNSDYDATNTSLNYVGLALDSIAGFTDLSDPENSLVDLDFPHSMRIDSIFALVSHENNSGNYDYITMQIVELSPTGVPTNNVLWEQKDSSNTTLSSGGNWVGSGAVFLLSYAPNFTTPWDQKVGLVLKYNDATKTDTFSISAGYMATDTNPDVALKSTFKNSYMRYPPNIPNITPCSNVGYGNPVGSQGWFQAQNWGMWVYATTDPVGINENSIYGIKLSQNSPNPSSGITSFNYELIENENIYIELMDMQGRKVLSRNEGIKSAGSHRIELQTNQLDAGTYFYSLITDSGKKLTRKLVVSK